MPAKLCRLRGVADRPDGLRRRLYGGGSRREDWAGEGDETFRTGLRDDDASRFDRRLSDRPAAGAGEADSSRRGGTVDDGRPYAGAELFREVLGVVVLR